MSEAYNIPIRQTFETKGFIVTYKKPTVTITELGTQSKVYFTEGIDCKAIDGIMYTTSGTYTSRYNELVKAVNKKNADFLNSIPQSMRVEPNAYTLKSDTHLNVEPELKAIRSQLDRIKNLVKGL